MTLPLINPDNPTTSTSGFGRVFFGGGNTLYYSPVLEHLSDIGRCYQVNDPTSDEISDLLDTDGGVVKLQDSGEIVDLAVFRVGVLVFTENGVWYVYNNQSGFRSTAYQVSKISEEVIRNKGAVVEAKGVLYFATEAGINVVVPNEFDNLSVQSVTDDTVLTYYKTFIQDTPLNVTYDRQKTQIWFFGGNGALIRDLRTNAWYPQTLGEGNRGVLSGVYRNNETLFVNSELSTLTDINYNFATDTNTLFQDFGEDTEAFLMTGFETLGKFSHKKSSTIGSFFFNKTETQVTGFDVGTGELEFDLPSSCTLQLRWDFDSSNSFSKWVTVKPDLYQPTQRGFVPPDTDALPWAFDTGESLIRTKAKLRGNGRAVQMRFEAAPQKDLQLLGYSVEYTMKGRQ